jgi:cell fate regulator YaaT (PSP1 superfamily)
VDSDGEHVFSGEETPASQGVLTHVGVVRFTLGGRLYAADAGEASYAVGASVLCEADKGVALATLVLPTARKFVREPLRRILRPAEPRDDAARERNDRLAASALTLARERVRERRMPIKMYRVEYSLGGTRALFYFSSEDRIDFRDLVRDLSARLHVRIEMRQTGVRDEAKLVGGIGSCGQELCCTTFLPKFEPVSIKMAKDQGLVLNPSRVSGQCGRLKCCLVYEEAAYHELRKGLPKVGKRVATPNGEGRVAEVDVLRQRIRVSYEPGEFQTFSATEVTAVVPPPQGHERSGPPQPPGPAGDQGSGPATG